MITAAGHDRRRAEILCGALDVFIKEGFADTTFQKISDRCGITRTTLYVYFRNKKEIFSYSIKQLLAKAEGDILLARQRTDGGSIEKITVVLADIFRQLEENRRLLHVVLDYILYFSRSGLDASACVRRRTVRLRHILSSLVIPGIKSGEIKNMEAKAAGNFLYGFIEAAIFRLAVLRQESVGELKETAVAAVRALGQK